MTNPTLSTTKSANKVPVWVCGLAAAGLAATLDQATKWLIVTIVMDPPRVIPVTPFFNLTLGLNRGVSFGMLGWLGETPWVLIGISSAIVVGLLVWLWRVRRMVEAIGLGAIVGGALGNILDRMRLGGVVDFLDFHVAGWHWPAFNMADSAITVGVSLLLLNTVLEERSRTREARRS